MELTALIAPERTASVGKVKAWGHDLLQSSLLTGFTQHRSVIGDTTAVQKGYQLIGSSPVITLRSALKRGGASDLNIINLYHSGFISRSHSRIPEKEIFSTHPLVALATMKAKGELKEGALGSPLTMEAGPFAQTFPALSQLFKQPESQIAQQLSEALSIAQEKESYLFHGESQALKPIVNYLTNSSLA